jgi:D-sedoheptulose 7-phosphate isomerase
MSEYIRQQLSRSVEIFDQLLRDGQLVETLGRVAKLCTEALKEGNKILFAGNGGSAADSQHLAGEFVSRFAFDRPGLFALALTTDTSVLTAIGNDYGYEQLFARQIQAVGTAGDVFFAISTSGRSPNVLEALRMARRKRLHTVGFTGNSDGPMAEYCDFLIRAPAQETPKIQEVHITLGHIICGLVEVSYFSR